MWQKCILLSHNAPTFFCSSLVKREPIWLHPEPQGAQIDETKTNKTLLLHSHYQKLRLGQWFPRSEQWFMVSYWMILAVMMISTFSQAFRWNNKVVVVLSHQLGVTVTDSENIQNDEQNQSMYDSGHDLWSVFLTLTGPWRTWQQHTWQWSWPVVCLSYRAVYATAHMTVVMICGLSYRALDCWRTWQQHTWQWSWSVVCHSHRAV